MNTFGYYLRGLADLILPRECIVCGRKLGIREDHLCIYCMADFPFTFFWQMERNPMADKFNALISSDSDRLEYEPYSYAAALFVYHSEADYKYIPYGIKYGGNTWAGTYFGRLLGQKVSESDFLKDIDLIIPVPLHRARLLKRGYNQAEVLAAAIAKEIGAPMCTGLLCRKKSTKTQTRLSVEEKRENVRNAFAVNEREADRVTKRLAPKHIAIVDDIFTTGSTIYSCRRTLRQVFGRDIRITALSLGFVSTV